MSPKVTMTQGSGLVELVTSLREGFGVRSE